MQKIPIAQYILARTAQIERISFTLSPLLCKQPTFAESSENLQLKHGDDIKTHE